MNTVTVSIGAVDAKVSFAGLLPGTIGVYQVKAVIPSGVSPGNNVPVVITVAGQQSQPATIAIR